MSAPVEPAGRRAVRLEITGVVQGVGFRPFVYRLARRHEVAGWVLNANDGVHVVAEGGDDALTCFVAALQSDPPPAARIATFQVTAVPATGFQSFEIRGSSGSEAPTTRISPDLTVCNDCLSELFDSSDRRFWYPYINCTNCGPRYSIVLRLPYDRPHTVMRDWPLCDLCLGEYENPADRRFHAQPVACPQCGPTVQLEVDGGLSTGTPAIVETARLLNDGAIVAIKGIGGYHLACDARNAHAVETMRERKYRKERPFAVMVRDVSTARTIVELDGLAEELLTSVERPIVLAPARCELEGVAPQNRDLGLMIPYAPLHHLLFAAGAPGVLVMTSANRSSEPIAYEDDDARSSLRGIADGFLVGQRPIARRVDDSIVRPAAPAGVVLRRSRGLAPRVVATFPNAAPILAVGGDLKNAIVLVVNGQAFGSQHIGDLGHLSARDVFAVTVADLCAMYDIRIDELTIAYDLHPDYASTAFALSLPGTHVAIQHHRAHIASVLAERGAWETSIIGCAFDGTGCGDDATIWGGEIFRGSLAAGFERIAHLRPALLPGGDAAARFPVQAAAGFLHEIDVAVSLEKEPFRFPPRYFMARRLVERRLRTFPTTSVGRLFDTVAALLGFVGEQTFEGQAAMWLEQLAHRGRDAQPYPFPVERNQLDFAPLLTAIVADRLRGRELADIARAFHAAVASAVVSVAHASGEPNVAVSGGVFQNALLLEMLRAQLGSRLWYNTVVPANDGGLSLGQAALACRQTSGGFHCGKLAQAVI